MMMKKKLLVLCSVFFWCTHPIPIQSEKRNHILFLEQSNSDCENSIENANFDGILGFLFSLFCGLDLTLSLEAIESSVCFYEELFSKVESGADGSVDGETVENASMIDDCTIVEVNNIGGSSFEPDPEQGQGDDGTQGSAEGVMVLAAVPAVSVVSPGEPYVGQEFDSEGEAHAYYNAYATSIGFILRVSKLSRSRIDNTAIGRIFVCNKEGFRMPDKRENIVRQRAETRVGCKAMIMVRKIKSGKWVVTKFVKEHTHPLAAPGTVGRDCIYEVPSDNEKIRELTQQLASEKKRSATYKRHLEHILEHIDDFNESLSKKIQHIVDNVKEIEPKNNMIS